MRFVYVLEDDPKFQKEIVDAIQGIDPLIQVRLFKELKPFASWIKYMMTTGPASISKGGEVPSWITAEPVNEAEAHQLVAVISKIEFLGSRQIPLMKKTRELFISRQICTKEDPTAFVLTTFEDPEFKIKDLEDRILNNIIFKPFDKLILSQHLTFAIDGRHPPSKYTIANQKMSALVEMLKEVKMLALSEVGFITISNRPLDKGKVSKYYGTPFITERQKSLMASTVHCQLVEGKTDEYISTFLFFGANPAQVSNIRKNIRTHKATYEHDWSTLLSDTTRLNRDLGIILIDEDHATCDELAETIKRNFDKVQFAQYQNFTDFIMELDPKLADKTEGQPAKALPTGATTEFLFDQAGIKLEEVTTTAKDPVIVFGKRIADLLAHGNTWSIAIGEQMAAWKEWIQSPKDFVIAVQIDKNIFYVKPTSMNRDELTKKIKVTFEELSVADKTAYVLAHSKIPQKTDLIFISHRFLQPTDGEKWLKINDLLKQRSGDQNFNSQIVLLASKDYVDSELIQLSQIVTDIFYKPIDRSYILRKMHIWFPELKVIKDDLNIVTLPHDEGIFTASPVQISEISEAGLVMQYYRSISLGSFRDFVLWQPYEAGAPRVIATCNYFEETAQKGIFSNHFVFYGMTDLFLKSIRIWIRDNYINQKEQGN